MSDSALSDSSICCLRGFFRAVLAVIGRVRIGMNSSFACLVLAMCVPLTACSKSLASPNADTPIAESDVPRLKAGLWRHVLVIDGKSGSADECDAARPLIAPAQGDCSNLSIVKTAMGDILLESRCEVQSVTTSLRASYKGDFELAFTSDVVGTVREPGRDPDPITGHESYRYLGPCPAAMNTEHY
jgi:hypothetical protein